MDKLGKQPAGDSSTPLSSSRAQIHLVTDHNQDCLSEEMKVLEVELEDQYVSHVQFLRMISGVKDSEVQQLKAQLDKQLARNAEKAREVRLLAQQWQEMKKNQEDVIPVSQRLRPSTSASTFRISVRSRKTSGDVDFIPVLLERIGALEQEAIEVEENCLMREAESERILQMLSIEKQSTVPFTQLILRERMQQARELHRRFLKKYDDALQTRFVARNHLVLAENEVIKQKVNNEDLRRRFKDSMAKQREVRQSTEQDIQESIEKLSLKSIKLKGKHKAKVEMFQQVEHSLEELISTRKSLQTYGAQLAEYKRSFSTILK